MRPVCVACRLKGGLAPLTLTCVEEERNDDVRAGILQCDACGSRYPILDGLPVLVPDLSRYLSDNLFYLTMRRDLSPAVADLLAEATGPGAGLDAIRQHVSSYGWDHWADRDPAEAGAEQVEPGQAARIMAHLLDGIPASLPPGPLLDLGCGAGRTVAELAEHTDQLVLGLDLSVPLARVAQDAVVGGQVAYDRRRGGLHFERRAFDVPAHPRCDIWIADALALPFVDASFALVTAINLLDCVADPSQALAEFGRVLMPDGACALATPFDWSGAATPLANWLGGRAAQSAHKGRPEQALDALLSDGAQAAGSLRRSRPTEEAEWQIRLHDRSSMRYLTHLSWSANALVDVAT
ncbi:ubiquinone/menaquinone biosynthesis C-methylase UbiE/uncharacterized protein YbaR (Trm112 family) [Aureimonas pseudogalii]|uniref:Ubiquinone/menaquinone biosynthesis C-methylase UbiE/uncharacterized protein YbaR (Trm112 family) n=1 Tax=Aureimonas pseudogalii TaxID=1744844 RepID=A0A7W6H8A7_9HYPH|nr:ubiquinone/menaquinone biosynthesis C-methylase UbiE/uncharacterized protein YbaR (Trm112 family) [Aureimonas pseudogalii]